jgi:predicted aconitase
MLRGDFGPATKVAMSIVARMADVAEAERLLNITGAHIDISFALYVLVAMIWFIPDTRIEKSLGR